MGAATSTGTTSRCQRPTAWAAAHWRWLRRAKASWSARVTWNFSATFSAVSPSGSVPWSSFMRGLTNRQPSVESKAVTSPRAKASRALPITRGARDIDSTPPAMIRSASPVEMARAPSTTACSPEPHSRLTVAPGTETGSPASSAAMRATLRLSSPAWLAQPNRTSSMASGSTFVRATSARTTTAARSSGRTSARAPPWRPTGVRRASTTKTSRPPVIVHLTQGAGKMGGRSMARRVRCSSISLISTAGATVETGT